MLWDCFCQMKLKQSNPMLFFLRILSFFCWLSALDFPLNLFCTSRSFHPIMILKVLHPQKIRRQRCVEKLFKSLMTSWMGLRRAKRSRCSSSESGWNLAVWDKTETRSTSPTPLFPTSRSASSPGLIPRCFQQLDDWTLTQCPSITAGNRSSRLMRTYLCLHDTPQESCLKISRHFILRDFLSSWLSGILGFDFSLAVTFMLSAHVFLVKSFWHNCSCIMSRNMSYIHKRPCFIIFN